MRDFEIREAKAPCQDCMIVWMQADVDFLEDEHAGAEEGMWLHHTVLRNEANEALHNCDKAKRRQKFFASGNERSVMDLSLNGYAVSHSVSVFVVQEMEPGASLVGNY
jgi:hypothetical protein